MEQSLLSALHDDIARAANMGIQIADFDIHDMKPGLSVEGALGKLASLMLDGAVSLSEANTGDEKKISIYARLRDWDVVLGCHCVRTDGAPASAPFFRLEEMSGIAKCCGGETKWDEWRDGAAVSVRLPYQDDVSGYVRTKAEPCKILILEPDAHSRRKIRGALAAEGYRILDTETLDACRELLDKGTPDLLIFCKELSEKPVAEFCRELRKKSCIPVLFVTREQYDENVLCIFGKGYDMSFKKPYPLDLLANHIDTLLLLYGREPCAPSFCTLKHIRELTERGWRVYE